MKTIILLSFLVVSSCGHGASAIVFNPSRPPIVLVCEGQSNNTEGRRSNMGAYRVNKKYEQLPSNVKWLAIHNNTRPGGTRFRQPSGVSVCGSAAHELADEWPSREIFILHHEHGGSGISKWLHADYARANETLAGLFHPGIPMADAVHVVVWIHGEKDQNGLRSAEKYYDRFKRLDDFWRNKIHSLDYFVIQTEPVKRKFYWRKIKKAKKNYANKHRHAYFVHSRGVMTRNDDVHLAPAGRIKLGRRVAKKIINLDKTRNQ